LTPDTEFEKIFLEIANLIGVTDHKTIPDKWS
jgi:hypothetical protein